MKHLLIVFVILIALTMNGCVTTKDQALEKSRAIAQATMALQLAEMQRLIFDWGVRNGSFAEDASQRAYLLQRAETLTKIVVDLAKPTKEIEKIEKIEKIK